MDERVIPAKAAKPDRVLRIDAIEGARGWLAWTVVIGHIIQLTGLDYAMPRWHVFPIASSTAVSLFIIISGFVITGLLFARKEPWTDYITRRAFRIFPAYLIALAASVVTLHLINNALGSMDWVSQPTFRYDDSIRNNVASVHGAPWAHAALDLSLLQGIVPGDLLLRSQTAILSPAWSLSLEWQFYLIAPFLIAALADKRWRVPTLIIVFSLIGLYRLGLFGKYSLASFFPGSAHYFLIGIASRFAFDAARTRLALPGAVVVGCLGMAAAFLGALAVFLWAALFVFITNADRWKNGIDAIIARVGSWLVESPPARYFGARSYSVYIIHWPILQGMAALLLTHYHLNQFEALAVIGAVTIVLTLAASDLLYRFVERPMIRVGAQIVSRRKVRTGEVLDQALQARTP